MKTDTMEMQIHNPVSPLSTKKTKFIAEILYMQDHHSRALETRFANPCLLCSQYLTKLKPLSPATLPFGLSSSLSPSLPFSFLVSAVEMDEGNKQSYVLPQLKREVLHAAKEENTPPATPAKRVRFCGKEEPPLPPCFCLTAVRRVLLDFNY
jgi:hypothetical protein